MKTKLIIEIETNKFTKINSEEDLSGEDITEEVEEAFHNGIFKALKSLVEKVGDLYEVLETEVLENTDELAIEGLECFKDYTRELNFKIVAVESK